MRLPLVALVSITLGACVVPNMVLPTSAGAASRAELHAPQRAEWVEIAAADGAVLRGVWVPGETGAPVVLQLMESTVGATEARRTHGVYWDLPAAGYALLAMDYRGVAASGGTRSTEHLRADARTMWREAVARAGGDPARVVLRGGSLGALAIAALLQDGARPGAVVLYGPVRSESVVKHFMVTGWAGTPRVPDALAPWLALLFRRPLAVDLVREVAHCRAPLLLICGARDELLPPAEADRLRAEAECAGGRFVLEDLAHVELCTRHHRLHDEERAFLRAALPVEVDLAARERAALAALGAIGAAEPSGASRAQLRELLERRIEDPPAVLAGLLAAGFDAARTSRWLDADLAVRGRWLAGLEWGSVRELAAGVAVHEDRILLAVVERLWSGDWSRTAELRAWRLEGAGASARLWLEYHDARPAGSLRVQLALPAGDLWREAAMQGEGAAVRLRRLVRTAAAGRLEAESE